MSNPLGRSVAIKIASSKASRQMQNFRLIWQRALTWSRIPQEKFGFVGTGSSTRST